MSHRLILDISISMSFSPEVQKFYVSISAVHLLISLSFFLFFFLRLATFHGIRLSYNTPFKFKLQYLVGSSRRQRAANI